MSDEHSPAGGADGRRNITRATYEWTSTSPTTAVIETVAAATGQEPIQLEPLFDTLDPEALDMLFRAAPESAAFNDIQVTFRYHGRDVTVRGDGAVAVTVDGHEPGGG